MGWFSRQEDSSPADTVRPISQERLIKIFDEEEWHYVIDDDNDLGGRWGDAIFYFLFHGEKKEILQIIGRFMPVIPEEYLDEFRVFIEDWHRDYIWPKAYRVYNNDGELQVCGEVIVDYEHGATDKQLKQHIDCAISTSLQLFNALKDRFDIPELESNKES